MGKQDRKGLFDDKTKFIFKKNHVYLKINIKLFTFRVIFLTKLKLMNEKEITVKMN
jgi:hypothetical protein